MKEFYRIISPSFVAGIEYEDDKCIRVAPILKQFADKDKKQTKATFHRNRWIVQKLWGEDGTTDRWKALAACEDKAGEPQESEDGNKVADRQETATNGTNTSNI